MSRLTTAAQMQTVNHLLSLASQVGRHLNFLQNPADYQVMLGGTEASSNIVHMDRKALRQLCSKYCADLMIGPFALQGKPTTPHRNWPHHVTWTCPSKISSISDLQTLMKHLVHVKSQRTTTNPQPFLSATTSLYGVKEEEADQAGQANTEVKDDGGVQAGQAGQEANIDEKQEGDADDYSLESSS